VFCPYAPVWGDVATWVAGIATAGTLFFGIFQWMRLRVQSLKEQAAKLAEQRVAQARRIYAWREAAAAVGTNAVRIGNSSWEPVSRVVVHYLPENFADGTFITVEEMAEQMDKMAGASGSAGLAVHLEGPFINKFRALIQVLPPGKFWLGGVDADRVEYTTGVELAFTDNAGRHWIRSASGELRENDRDAIAHYGIEPWPSWDDRVAKIRYAHLIEALPEQRNDDIGMGDES
jgi:hypothetical protein